jgi:hypothetical protein
VRNGLVNKSMPSADKLTVMKNHLVLAALCAAFLIPNRSEAEITVEAFYEPLESYGDWIEVGDYGYCWQPRDIGSEWRPYTVGEWVYTDAGWTWDSDEPYGWATYHYGRWVRLSGRGWVWVPDTEWGPSWVSWRHSDRYTGWAPLPPESHVSVGVSLGGWVDAYFDVGPTAYSFVETRYLGAPRLASVLVPARQNITIINETRNVTNISVVNNVIVNNGPDYNLVAQRAERPIRKLRLAREEVASVNAVTKAKIEGDTIRMATPRLAAQPGAKPRKLGRKVERAQVDNGWQDAGPAPAVQKVREKMKAEAKVPENLPPRPAAKERARTAARGDETSKGEAALPKAETGAPPAETATPPAETTAPPTADPAKTRGENTAKERKAGQKKQDEIAPAAESPKRRKNQPEPLPQREPRADKPELPESPAAQPDKRPDTVKPQGDIPRAETRLEKAKPDRPQADQPARQKERRSERVKPVEDPAQAQERIQRSKPNKGNSPQPPPALKRERPEPANPVENVPQAKQNRMEKAGKVAGAQQQRRNENRMAVAPQPQRPKVNAPNPNRAAQVPPAVRQGQPQAARKEGKKKGAKAEENVPQ